jgi:hypothetical protein
VKQQKRNARCGCKLSMGSAASCSSDEGADAEDDAKALGREKGTGTGEQRRDIGDDSPTAALTSTGDRGAFSCALMASASWPILPPEALAHTSLEVACDSDRVISSERRRSCQKNTHHQYQKRAESTNTTMSKPNSKQKRTCSMRLRS